MPNDTVLVTAICTTFNHEKYIESCLDGFLNQKTDFRYEVIVHDDCSADRTPDIVRRYAERAPDVIIPILQTENQYSKGVNIVGKLMMPLAKGRYIAFCEGDDAWTDASKLQRQVSFLESHPDYVACVHNTMFHRCDKPCKDFPMFVYDRDRDLQFSDILRWNAFGYQYSSLLVRREYFVSPPFGYGEYPMAMYLALSGKIRFLAQTMSEYRFRSGKFATRANVFSRRAMLAELEGTIGGLEKIRDYVTDDARRALIEEKIGATRSGLEGLNSMTDEQYAARLAKQERLFDLKLFVRAHFRRLYRCLVSRKR